MKEEVLKNYEYEEVEDILIEIVFETINFQKEGTIEDYKITYTDDCVINNIKINKEEDKYLITVDGIKGELKRDNRETSKLGEAFKLILKIFGLIKLSEISNIFFETSNKKKLLKQIEQSNK